MTVTGMKPSRTRAYIGLKEAMARVLREVVTKNASYVDIAREVIHALDPEVRDMLAAEALGHRAADMHAALYRRSISMDDDSDSPDVGDYVAEATQILERAMSALTRRWRGVRFVDMDEVKRSEFRAFHESRADSAVVNLAFVDAADEKCKEHGVAVIRELPLPDQLELEMLAQAAWGRA